LSAADDLLSSTRCLDEDRDRSLRTSARKIHCDGVEPALFETDDIGLHRRRVAGRSMTEDDSHDVYRRSVWKGCAWSWDDDQREKFRDLSQKNIS
jgi:hypothetical protein